MFVNLFRLYFVKHHSTYWARYLSRGKHVDQGRDPGKDLKERLFESLHVNKENRVL